MYIAHHLLTLGHQFRPGLPPPLDQGAATFIDLVPKLRRQGTGVFLRQMVKQRDLILDYLNAAEGESFTSTCLWVPTVASMALLSSNFG